MNKQSISKFFLKQDKQENKITPFLIFKKNIYIYTRYIYKYTIFDSLTKIVSLSLFKHILKTHLLYITIHLIEQRRW